MRVGFVEDDAGFRTYVHEVLFSIYEISFWTSAESFLSDDRHDLALLCVDLQLPHMDGIALIRHLRKNDVAPPCIVVSSVGSEAKIVEAIEAGAMGYFLKSDEASLKDAIATVLAGGATVSNTIMMRLIQSFQKQGRGAWRRTLTNREAQIVELLVEGRSRGNVAGVLGTSEETVKSQIASIYRKLRVSNRVELMHKINE